VPDRRVVDQGHFGSQLPKILTDYEFLGELGRGAMGVVLAARHRSLDRLVAIKELPVAFAADEEVRRRFGTEARTVAGLNHPHVVAVYDYFDRDGHLAIVMEQLPGGTLWDRFTTVGVTPQTGCALVLSAAAGLDHAHRNGVYHRDVKPENLLFAADGQLKVTDFGMAKVLTGSKTLATADGVVIGTPAYMAPEQAEGREIGPQADVYACGTLLFELLSGQLPFSAPTPVAMLVARVKEEAPSLLDVDPSIPAPVADVVRIALARQVADRYLAVEDFAVALGQAAIESWGEGWLGATGVAVTGSETIERASRTSLRASRRPVAEPDHTPGEAPATLIGALVPFDTGDLDLERPEEERPVPVVATPDTHHRTPDLSQLSLVDVIDVGEVVQARQIRRGRSPAVPWLLALGLVVGFAGLTILTPFTRSPSSGVGQPPLTVNGEVAADQPVAVDFTQPLRVSGLGPGSQASFEASLFGVPLGTTDGSVEGGEAVADPAYLRWTTAGVVDLEVTVDGGGLARTIGVAPTHRWYLNGPALVAALVGAFGLASIGAHLKGLRRGELRFGSLLGLAVAGSALGLSVFALVSMWQVTAPTGGLVLAAVGTAAGAVVAYGEGFRRWRRRQRRQRLLDLRSMPIVVP
jgi:serine/threonine-protein kinase